jgi:hypothetical protein
MIRASADSVGGQLIQFTKVAGIGGVDFQVFLPRVGSTNPKMRL